MASVAYQRLEVRAASSVAYLGGVKRNRLDNDGCNFGILQQPDSRISHPCSRVVWSLSDQNGFLVNADGPKLGQSTDSIASTAMTHEFGTFRRIFADAAHPLPKSRLCTGHQDSHAAQKPDLNRTQAACEKATPDDAGTMGGSISADSYSISSMSDEEEGSCTSSELLTDARTSRHNEGPLDNMSSLRACLPVKRRGLSHYFAGKSQSFTSLAEVNSITDLAKPENPFAKRRKSGDRDSDTSFPPRSSTAGISKRPVSANTKSSVVIAATRSLHNDSKTMEVSSRCQPNSIPLKCFSLPDLQEAAYC